MLQISNLVAQGGFCSTKPGSSYNLPSTTNFTTSNLQGNACWSSFVRIYVHVIRSTSGTGGQTVAGVNECLGYLDADFNQHAIFFIWDKEIDYINNDFYYNATTGDILAGVVFVNAHNDGIDIYLYEDDAHTFAVSHVSQRNNIVLSGSYPNDPTLSITKSHIISHEMGHVLGLEHTHRGCEGGGTLENPDGSNCSSTGDGFCDTPADPKLRSSDAPGFIDNVDATTCLWNGLQSDCPIIGAISDYHPDPLLIMSYTNPRCMSKFSPQQIGRMKFINLNSSFSFTGDFHIYENTLYSVDMAPSGNIIIHDGAELLVEATIYMAEGTTITVERNARLVVDNGGVLTVDCISLFWGGVRIMGNSYNVQPDRNAPLTDALQSGIVWLDNATIERAECGVHAGEVPDYSGGAVYANNTVFRNNQRAAQFDSYPFKPNKSRFDKTTFIDDLVDLFAIDNTEGVRIWETNGIDFNDCTFEKLDLEGIRSYDAAYRVVNSNEFKGNMTGISAYASFPMANNRIIVGDGTSLENSFSNNTYHINASTANGIWGQYGNGRLALNVINNNFEGGEIGIYIDGPSSYRLGGNYFKKVGTSAWPNNTGVQNFFLQNIIGCNRFKDGYNAGILISGNNRNVQFLGNTFEMPSKGTDFFLTNSTYPAGEGRIQPLQGNTTNAAGNCFTNTNSTDIVTWGVTTPFNYFHFPSTPIDNCRLTPSYLGNYSNLPSTFGLTPDYCVKFGGLPNGMIKVTKEDLEIKRKLIGQLSLIFENDVKVQELYFKTLEEKEAILRFLLSEAFESKNYEAAKVYLQGEQTKEADFAIFGLYMLKQDFNGASEWLNQLPSETQEDLDFKTIEEINIKRLQNIGQFELTEAQESTLNILAESTSPIRGYARGILGQMKDYRYYPESVPIEGFKGAVIERTEVNTISQLKVVPNPAFDVITVALPKIVDNMVARILVYDLLGNSYYDKNIDASDKKCRINTAQWHNGTYYLLILEAGKPTHHTKFTIQH
jgi:hypothetical protein